MSIYCERKEVADRNESCKYEAAEVAEAMFPPMSPLLITSDTGIHGFPVPLETRDHEANIKDVSPGPSALSKSGDPRIDHFFPFFWCFFFQKCLALNSNLFFLLTVGFQAMGIFSMEVIHCQAGPYELWWPSTLHGFLALAPEPLIENIEIRYVRLSFLRMIIS